MMKYILVISSVLFGIQVQAQNTLLLGQALNSDAVQEFINELGTEPVESFLPYRRVYKLSYPASGVELEFNTDMSLYQISFYDSGHTFGSYTGDLPYGAFWGIDSVQLQAEQGDMAPHPTNPFIKYYQAEDQLTTCYFRNGRLEHLKMTATLSLLSRTAASSLALWGMRLLPDGKAISGNLLDGDGIMDWGAARYEGEWMYGLPHGVGVYTDTFGNTYAGEFKLGFFWGSGSYISKTYAYRYDGYYLMGRMHGQGLIDYGQGRTYNGDWSRDRMHGVGQYTINANYFYQGEMRNNAFNGQGVLTTPDGYVKGQFKNGKPHGYCEQYAAQSQQTLSGYWVNGLKQGEFNLNAFGYDQKVLFKDDQEVSVDGRPKVFPQTD